MKARGLLALDLDGTILLPGEQAVPGIAEEVRAWQQDGWRVALITARYRKLPLIDTLGADAYTRNYGAQIYVGGQEIGRLSLPPDVIDAALSVAPQDSRLKVFTPEKTFVREPHWNSDRPFAQWRTDRDFVKLLLEHPDELAVRWAAKQWAALPGVALIWERPNACMLVAAGADKGSALQTVARFFEVPLLYTLAAGDGSSDAAMLRCAGRFLTVGRHPALVGGHDFVEGPLEVPSRLAQWRELYR